MLKKGAVITAGAITTAATVAATSAAVQTSTALQGLAGIGGSAPLTQAPTAIQQVRQTADLVPYQAVQDHGSLEDLSRSIDAVEQVAEVQDSTQMELAEKTLETVRKPSFDEPAITGLRKRE